MIISSIRDLFSFATTQNWKKYWWKKFVYSELKIRETIWWTDQTTMISCWHSSKEIQEKNCIVANICQVNDAWFFTPPILEIIWVKNVRAIVVCGFLIKSLKKHILKIWKKSWVPFRSYLLNSTANPAHFYSSWAGLAVLFSR